MTMSSQRGNASHDSSSEASSDEDESSSSSLPNSEPVGDVLASFREKWQKELQISPQHRNHQNDNNLRQNSDMDQATKARNLYLKGIEMERSGKVYEAMLFYRRAVQLDPDIESHVNFKPNKPQQQQPEHHIEENRAEISDEEKSIDDEDEEDEEDVKEGQLLNRIQRKLMNLPTICVPKLQQKTTHISALPTEMILYILRWVISSDLDLRSLEMFSRVCRGFYLCARDPELWRLACLRVWGLNCGSCPVNYLSWRHMFIERTRLQFNGCYIGKTSYLRHGENSFQDQFYRPWHLVTYYRYLRFFPEGIVLVLTSADEPAQCVGQMKSRNARSPICKGYYRLKDDKVTLIVQKMKHLQNYNKKHKRRGDYQEAAEETYHMELQIKNTNKKRHVQLVWTHYSITRSFKGDESTSTFELVGNRFPPFWFSRVKSYTAESEQPLQ